MDVISSSIDATKKILLMPFTLTKKGIQIYAGIKRFSRFTEPKVKTSAQQKIKNNDLKKRTGERFADTVMNKEEKEKVEVNLKEVINEYKNKNRVLDTKKEEILKYKAERVQNVKENSLDKGSRTQSINYKDLYEQRGKRRELDKEYDREIER